MKENWGPVRSLMRLVLRSKLCSCPAMKPCGFSMSARLLYGKWDSKRLFEACHSRWSGTAAYLLADIKRVKATSYL